MTEQECPARDCREEWKDTVSTLADTMKEKLNDLDDRKVGHKALLGYISIPVGVMAIIVGLIMTIVSLSMGNLDTKVTVSKQRNDSQDSKISELVVEHKTLQGDMGIIKVRLDSIDKHLNNMSLSIEKLNDVKIRDNK